MRLRWPTPLLLLPPPTPSSLPPPPEPALEAFEAQVARYKSIQDELASLPATAPVGWLRADARPLRQALLTWASKWAFLYVQRLQAQVCVGGGACGGWVGRWVGGGEEGGWGG